jgi:hypothetical protein
MYDFRRLYRKEGLTVAERRRSPFGLPTVALALVLLLAFTFSLCVHAEPLRVRWYAGTGETAKRYGVKATITVPSSNPYAALDTFTLEWITVDNASNAWVQAGWVKGLGWYGNWYNSPTAYIEHEVNGEGDELTYGTLTLGSSHSFQVDWNSTYYAWRVLIDGSNKGYFSGDAMNAPQWVSAKGETSSSGNTMGPSTLNPVKYANSSLTWYNFSSSDTLAADSPYHVSGYPYNFRNWGP